MGDTGLATDLSRGPEVWSPAGLLKVPGPQRCPGSDQSNKYHTQAQNREGVSESVLPWEIGKKGGQEERRKKGRQRGGREGGEKE